MGEFVLVIGASLMDTKGKPSAGLEPGTSNPATIRSTRGGTARNVAENLALLGAEVILISAVGDDYRGRSLVESTANAGVDVTNFKIVENGRTGQYIAVIDESGHLSVALDDTAVMDTITPAYLEERQHLFENADLVVLDGGLSDQALATAVELAVRSQVPLCVDPSSTRLAPRLCPYLPKIDLIVPNELEAAAICGRQYPNFDIDTSILMARDIMSSGVRSSIITLSDFGLVYATAEESGYVPPQYSKFIDSTGTGDAIAAAVIFGQVNGLPSVECMRLGAAAAGLTLQTAESVYPELSLDVLYDHLTI